MVVFVDYMLNCTPSVWTESEPTDTKTYHPLNGVSKAAELGAQIIYQLKTKNLKNEKNKEKELLEPTNPSSPKPQGTEICTGREDIAIRDVEISTLEPQGGLSVINTFLKAKLTSMGLNTDVTSIVENTVAALIAASDSTTNQQFLMIMFLYLKSLYSHSVTEVACTYLAQLFGAKYTPQGGEVFTSLKVERPAWLTELKSLSTTWTLALHAEGFHKIAKLLSFCVALGMCKLADITPTVAGFELFSLPPPPKDLTVVSVVDMVFDLIVHFAEGAYLCFHTKSIKPLLYGSFDHQKFSDMFHLCLRCSTLYRAGNLDKEKMDENDYDKLLTDTIDLCETLLLQARGSLERSIFSRQKEKLHTWMSAFNEVRLSGGLRVSPYCIGLFGDTAVGKSTLCPILMSYVLLANGYSADDNRVITIKETDKFMSTTRSYVNGMILDDAGNTNPAFVTTPPTEKIIEVVNNTKIYANMADVDLKGKVSILPKVFIVTKNVKDAGASVYSNAPASVCRRDTVTVTVRVKEPYSNNGMLDTRKILALHPEGTELFPDLWHFQVQTAYPIPGPSGAQSDVGWRDVVWNGHTLTDINLKTFICFLRDDTHHHFKVQDIVVRNGTNVASRLKICPECRCPTQWMMCPACCALCAEETPVEAPSAPEEEPPPLPHLHVDSIQTPQAPVPVTHTAPEPKLFNTPLEIPIPPVEEEPVVTETISPTPTLPENPPDDFSIIPGNVFENESVVQYDAASASDSWDAYEEYMDRRDELLMDEINTGERIYHTRFMQAQGVLSDAWEITPTDRKRGFFVRKMMDFFGKLTFIPSVLGNYVAKRFSKFLKNKAGKYAPLSVNLIKRLETATTDVILERLNELDTSVYSSWTTYIPESWFSSSLGKDIVARTEWPTIRKRALKRYYGSIAATIGVLCGCVGVFYFARTILEAPPKYIGETSLCNELSKVNLTSTFLDARSFLLGVVKFFAKVQHPLDLMPTERAPIADPFGDMIRHMIKIAWKTNVDVGVLVLRTFTVVFATAFVTDTATSLQESVRIEREALLTEITERRDLAVPLLKRIRDTHLEWICGSSAAIAAVYIAVKTYRAMTALDVQGNIEPKTPQDVEVRDAEGSPWARAEPEPYIAPPKSRCIRFTDLVRMTEANTTHVHLRVGMRSFRTGAFFPCSNVAIIPRHMWLAPEMDATFVRREADLVGATFNAKLSRAFSVDVPNSDLSVVWVPSGGDWRDLTEYFPLTYVPAMPARLLHRTQEGNIQSSGLMLRPGKVNLNGANSYIGGVYELEFPTFGGLCMSALVSETVAPMIIGFHLCGRTGEPLGGMGTLLQHEFTLAMKELRAKPAVLLAKSDTPHDKKQFGISYCLPGDIHPKSATRFLPDKPNCRIYGPVDGRTTPRTTVVPSPLSEHIASVCGVPQQWGPPPMHEGYKWQESLAFSSQPAEGVEASVLIIATQSYQHKLRGIGAGAMKYLLTETRPLTRVETISGIDGKRFVDSMKSSTAIGFPFNGPKSKLLVAIDSPEHQNARDVAEDIWKAVVRTQELYLKGERTTQIFKACMKDEPTKIGKDKVRIFQGAPLVLQILMRMYFLPLARLVSLFPTISECAVGINSESREWEQMDAYVYKHGDNRVLAGDYSKYDLRMPAQLILVAFRILIDLAKRCAYSEEDLCIMEGCASEVAYAYTAYNGDLIKFLGSNPSGHNLTVYINSIVNSLLMRCAFYSVYPREAYTSFNDHVALITYGDDVVGTVNRWYQKFNHLSVAKYMESINMKFTMPDKSAVPTKFMLRGEVDFLKRRSFHNPDIDCVIGILADESIFKSLHCQMLSKHATQQEIAAQNIDGAIRSWFFHGREVFTYRQEQLSEVAHRADIAHMCDLLNVDYDQLVAAWQLVNEMDPGVRKRKQPPPPAPTGAEGLPDKVATSPIGGK